jgi:hypothetical protein
VAVLRSLPRCVLWERQQAPEAVREVRARKRARLAPPDQWRTLEDEERLLAELEAAETARKQLAGQHAPDSVAELPAAQPIGCVVVLMDGAEFLALHSSGQLQSSLTAWLACLARHAEGGKSLLLLVHGLYAQVQMRSNQSMQQRRADGAPVAPASKPAVKPLKNLAEVDALLAQLWFTNQGKVRFKMVSESIAVHTLSSHCQLRLLKGQNTISKADMLFCFCVFVFWTFMHSHCR